MSLPRIHSSGIAQAPLSRRGFLKAGAIVSTSITGLVAPDRARATNGNFADAVIQIRLSGGPSQLDTFDLKPMAPTQVRGPFQPIQTNVVGMQISELFPRLAGHADKFAIVRSLHQDMPPVHEIGARLLDGSSVGLAEGKSAKLLTSCSKNARGSSPGHPGAGQFGLHCRQAIDLVKSGAGSVTIEMFPTLYDCVSWDCHANEADLRTTLDDYRHIIGPMFDAGLSSLLADLAQTGLLERTLVVCAGEFGRSPRLNPRGGRDHWTGVWSALFAGGGIRGGQVIGSSDRLGGEPRDLPFQGTQVAPTILHALGIATPCQEFGKPILDLF